MQYSWYYDLGFTEGVCHRENAYSSILISLWLAGRLKVVPNRLIAATMHAELSWYSWGLESKNN